MIRLLFCIVLWITPALAQAATVYIDPTCTNNGDGTAGSPCAASGGAAGPKNTWVGLTWTAGNTYAGKGGTSQSLTSFQIGGSGTAGNLITITSYGTGQFKFTSSSTYAVATVSRSYLTFDSVTFESTATNCLYLTGVASNIIVRSSTFLTCGTTGQSGISIEGSSDTADIDNLAITGNNFTDLVGWAVRVNDVNVGNSATWNAWAITNNTVQNAGRVGNAGAFNITITGGSTAVFTNLTITGNTITDTGDEEASPVHLINLVRSPTGTVHEDRFKGINVSNNTITHGGGGISLNHVGVIPGTQNRIGGNTVTRTNASAAIIIFYSNNVLIDLNNVSVVATFAGIGFVDGIGIDLDLGNVGHTVRSNTITGCLGDPSNDSSGQGISIFGSNTNYIYGNLLVGNRYGVMFGDDNIGNAGVPNFLAHNTIVNSLLDGINTQFTVEQVNVIASNLVTGSGRYGMSSEGTGTQILLTNLFYGNTSGNYNSQTAGATDLTSNPLLQPNYKVPSTSPVKRAGLAMALCADVRGRACPSDRPNIGAYQSTSGDPAAPRAVRN